MKNQPHTSPSQESFRSEKHELAGLRWHTVDQAVPYLRAELLKSNPGAVAVPQVVEAQIPPVPDYSAEVADLERARAVQQAMQDLIDAQEAA